MKRNIEKIARNAEVADIINEGEAAKLLEITRGALQNKVYKGEMDGLFTLGVGGKRFWYKSKLVGIYK